MEQNQLDLTPGEFTFSTCKARGHEFQLELELSAETAPARRLGNETAAVLKFSR